jgi:glycosyltransferase involved in cell wall biosynthesis
MRVVHVSCTERSGGAAIAAHRIHTGLIRTGVDSYLSVARPSSADPRVLGPRQGLESTTLRVAGKLDAYCCRVVSRTNERQSAGLFGSRALQRAVRLEPDVVNLHWINGACVNLRQLGGLTVPAVWTLHDMWAFAGVDHYVQDLSDDWYCEARIQSDRARGWSLEQRLTRLKRRSRPKGGLIVVAPSEWMARCARSSHVFADADVRCIPNCIDTEAWRPMDRAEARASLNLPGDSAILLFSGFQGFTEKRKGGDLFVELTAALLGRGHRNVYPILVGDSVVPNELAQVCDARAMGHSGSTDELRRMYSAADFVVVPSRLDNLPNVAVEAMSCGVPVAGFQVGGMCDLIVDQTTGLSAPAYDVAALAGKVAAWLDQPARLLEMRAAARDRALTVFSERAVIEKYLSAYADLMNK